MLRDDRHYGAMGGLGCIWFSSLDCYARRHGIAGQAYDEFLMFMRALDDEYVAFVNAKQKAEAEERKNRGDAD